MSVVQIVLITLIAILVMGIIVAYMAAQESTRKKRVMGVIQGKVAVLAGLTSVDQRSPTGGFGKEAKRGQG